MLPFKIYSKCIQIPLQSPAVNWLQARGHHKHTSACPEHSLRHTHPHTLTHTKIHTHTHTHTHWGSSTVSSLLHATVKSITLCASCCADNQYEQRSITTFISLSVRCQSKSNYKEQDNKNFYCITGYNKKQRQHSIIDLVLSKQHYSSQKTCTGLLTAAAVYSLVTTATIAVTSNLTCRALHSSLTPRLWYHWVNYCCSNRTKTPNRHQHEDG